MENRALLAGKAVVGSRLSARCSEKPTARLRSFVRQAKGSPYKGRASATLATKWPRHNKVQKSNQLVRKRQ
jgi:hypothetical protein